MVVSVKVLMLCAHVGTTASVPSAPSAKCGKMGFGKAILEILFAHTILDVENFRVEAILRICKYLKETREDGLIMRPNRKLKVECYVDADFAGLYSAENPEDPISVKSRTG